MNTLGFAFVLALLPMTGGVLPHPQAAPQAVPAAAAPAPAALIVKTEDEGAFTVVGISVHTSPEREAGGDGEIRKLWQRMFQDHVVEQIPAADHGGLVAVYSGFGADGYTYTLGSRVSSVGKVPDGFVTVTVPAGKYAVVRTDEGSLQDILPRAWQQIMTMPAAELGGERADSVNYEQYPADLNWQDARVQIHVGLK